nr:unnamed protein product [Callosobruchus chinensis]
MFYGISKEYGQQCNRFDLLFGSGNGDDRTGFGPDRQGIRVSGIRFSRT